LICFYFKFISLRNQKIIKTKKMKKLLSVIFLSTMLFACNNEPANNNEAAKKEQLEN